MKFDIALKKNIFQSLDDSFSLTTRKELFDKNKKYLFLMKEAIEEKFNKAII